MFLRGDVVLCVLSGDFGKPRPAVIVQSDLFNETHSSITVCPLTSYLTQTPLFRITIEPNHENGLQQISQIMVDKVSTIKIDKIREKIGVLDKATLFELNRALRLWLDL